MTKRDDLDAILKDYEHKATALVAETMLRLKTIIENPDVEPRSSWLTVQDAAFRTKRSRKVVWAAAQRTPGAAWKDTTGRCYVDLDKLQFGPPAG